MAVAMPHIISGDRCQRLKSIARSGRMLALYSHCPTLNVIQGVVGWLLDNNFEFVSSAEAKDIVKSGCKVEKKVWLTFDDGRRSNLDNVVPFLRDNCVKATWFIAPRAIEDGFVWSDVLPISFSRQQKMNLLKLNDEERRKICNPWVIGYKGVRLLMTREELSELSRCPLFSFENHTLTHGVCSMMTVENVVQEVNEANEILLQWVGSKPSFVSYPYGHYSKNCDWMLRKYGFIPVYTSPGLVSCERVNRNCFYDSMSLLENSCRIVGAWRRINVYSPADEN